MHKILAAGCSHTDYYFKTLFHPEMDTSWPKWPEIFTDNFDDAICNNIGQSGIGNNRILKNVLYECSVTDYDIVLVLWTEITRIDVYDSVTFHPSLSRIEGNNFNRLHEKIKWIQEGLNLGFYELDSSVECFFKNLVILQEYCNSRSIKLVHGMANHTYDKKLIRKILFSIQKYKPLLNDSLIGFPFLTRFDGTHMRSEIIKKIGEENTFISDKDRHYTAAGQKVIGDIFYERFKTIY